MADGRPVRIAFYDAYASLDGSGMMLREIVRHLDRERFDPLALLPREGPLQGALAGEGCPVEVLAPQPPLDAYGRLLGAGVTEKLRGLGALRRYWGEVAGWLRGREVRLLHCNQTRAAVQAGPGARRAGVPVVWNVRIRETLPWYVVRVAERCADRIVPLTQDCFEGVPGAAERCADRIVPLTQDCFEGVPGAPRRARKSVVIPNAVDLTRFHPETDGSRARAGLGIPPDAPMLLSVGVLVPRKGFETLVGAMPAILREHPGTRLLIAGGPPAGGSVDHGRELERLADDLGVGDAVRLLGRRDDVPELLAASDIFVLASRQEGQPGAVLEAMATARPVVVTPAAAAGVENGRTGVIVPEDDPEALGRAVLGLLADRARAGELGRAARRQVERHHDVRAMVRAYERVYLDVLGEAR